MSDDVPYEEKLKACAACQHEEDPDYYDARGRFIANQKFEDGEWCPLCCPGTGYEACLCSPCRTHRQDGPQFHLRTGAVEEEQRMGQAIKQTHLRYRQETGGLRSHGSGQTIPVPKSRTPLCCPPMVNPAKLGPDYDRAIFPNDIDVRRF